MPATEDEIARLRRMVAEPGTETYDDAAIAAAIERYPTLDERGVAPYRFDSSTQPPTKVTNESWIPTYDLNAAAADIWEEKAAPFAADFDFSTENQSFRRSQIYDQMMAKARHHRSRRAPSTITAVKWPREGCTDDTPWIGNLPEPDEDI